MTRSLANRENPSQPTSPSSEAEDDDGSPKHHDESTSPVDDKSPSRGRGRVVIRSDGAKSSLDSKPTAGKTEATIVVESDGMEIDSRS